MTGALIILAVTVLTGLVLYIHHRLTVKPEDDVVTEPRPEDECCGQHEVCEKESLLQGLDQTIVYYDDEELDAFKGIAADSYTEDQIEQFRDVLYTLKSDDLAGWARSIQLRGITTPAPIHDELIMLLAEVRMAKAAKQQPAAQKSK